MVEIRLALVSIALALSLASLESGHLAAAEFSAEATALPFPPDAKNLEFTAWSGDIQFTSQSPLKALAGFYLKEMATRGWEHDEPAAEVKDDSIRLRFKHDDVSIKLYLSQWSKEVRASLDCEKLKFTGVDDPAKLAQAGLPVPRAILFVQKELPLPADAMNLQYTGEGCMFKSALTLPETFDHFMRLAQSKGFRESRRPIITETRRYTEFKKGAAELSVNVFTDAVGSRAILRYKDDAKEKSTPPLAAVASLPLKGASTNQPGAGQPATNEPTPTSVGTTPINVASNKGSAAVNYNGKQYTFTNVASFQTKSRGSSVTMVVFQAKPIPLSKLQTLISKDADFSYGDLYEFSAPERLIVQLSEHLSFQFTLPSLGVSNSIENPVNEMKVEGGRVQGTLKMPTRTIFGDESFAFTATINAAIMTPTTRITGPGDAVVRSDHPLLTDSPVPFPDAIENAGREGSKFRKKYNALVRKPLAEVAAFYRKELTAKGWTQPNQAVGDTIQFKNDALESSVVLKPQGTKTAVEVSTRDIALAKQEGVFPEPGKGRLVLGNANNIAVVFTIGNTNYSLKPEQGAKDYKQAVNQSLPPGKYVVVLKVPGQPAETERIDLAAGTTWGLIALPMGGCLPVQLY